MNDLNLHISRLLLEHNCVIVPELGGFVTQYCPAYFDEVAGAFVAPSYQVGFNPLLQADDGVLAQSFMVANQTSYDEAIHDIRLCVHQLRESLRTRKEVTLFNVGTFKLGVSGTYEFTPVLGGIEVPHLFGLSALPLQKLHKKENVKSVASLQSQKDSYTFHVSKSMLRSVAAAAVAIVFYFVWAAPLNRHASTQANEAQMFDQIANVLGHVAASPEQKLDYQLHFQPQPADTGSISVQELMRVEKDEKVALSTTKEQHQLQNAEVHSESVQYTLVIASQVPLSGAQKLVQQLQSTGIAEARVAQRHNMVRVVVGRFNSYDEAHKHLNQMRAQSESFADSWVLKENSPH